MSNPFADSDSELDYKLKAKDIPEKKMFVRDPATRRYKLDSNAELLSFSAWEVLLMKRGRKIMSTAEFYHAVKGADVGTIEYLKRCLTPGPVYTSTSILFALGGPAEFSIHGGELHKKFDHALPKYVQRPLHDFDTIGTHFLQKIFMTQEDHESIKSTLDKIASITEVSLLPNGDDLTFITLSLANTVLRLTCESDLMAGSAIGVKYLD